MSLKGKGNFFTRIISIPMQYEFKPGLHPQLNVPFYARYVF